mgnify:CR=1 FL=1
MLKDTIEYLSTKRGLDEFGRPRHSTMNNDGGLLVNYALTGDFAIIEEMSREFVNGLYERDGDKPFHLLLYDTGVGYALFHLIRAWNQWHETTYNVDNTMSVMFYDKGMGEWIEHTWYGKRP